MFWLRNKNNNFQLLTLIWRPSCGVQHSSNRTKNVGSKSAPTSVCDVFNTMHTYTDTQFISIREKIISDSLVTQMVIGKFGYQRKYCLRRFSLAPLLSIW